MFTTMQKKGAINIKNTRRMVNQSTDAKKSLFYENVLYLTSFSQDLGLFVLFFIFWYIFFRTFFYCNLISWDFIGCPQTMLGRKVPGIKITGLYFQWNFFSKNLRKFELFSKVFISSFFPKSISRDFLT